MSPLPGATVARANSTLALDVGDTKSGQCSFSPDLPIASTTLILTTLNLTFPLSPIGFLFALASFFISLANVHIQSRNPARVSRPTTATLLILASISLLFSRTTALGNEPQVHVVLNEDEGVMQRSSLRNPLNPPKQLVVDSAPRRKRDVNDLPVNALEAVERIQRALPNAGDVATEAHENSLDETRDTGEGNFLKGIEKTARPPNLNGTFIVNTHTAESW